MPFRGGFSSRAGTKHSLEHIHSSSLCIRYGLIQFLIVYTNEIINLPKYILTLVQNVRDTTKV